MTRLEKFYKVGCRFTDHALDNGFFYYEDDGENNARFKKLLDKTITKDDEKYLSSYMLTFLAKEYAKKGFVMQLHIGAQRSTSTKLRNAAGKAASGILS